MMIAAVVVIGILAYLCFQLNSQKNQVVENLTQVESRNNLLNQKYKEEKAQVGRLQRENLKLSGQARQAQMDMETFKIENEQFRQEHDQLVSNLQACDSRKAKLSERIERLREIREKLTEKCRDTAMRLNKSEEENKELQGKLDATKAELQAAESRSNRYYSHNQRLSQIAITLAARVEHEELGSSVLVKEPLIQFKRVELENLVQDYLDRIDKEKIVKGE